MHKNTIIALIIGLAIIIFWPLTTYLIYPVPPESVEPIIKICDEDLPLEKLPGFLIGIGGLVRFRDADFRARGVPISLHHRVAIFRIGTGETIIVMFMPRYRSVDEGYELSGDELAELIDDGAILRGYAFLTRRGIVLTPTKVVVGNKTFIAVPPYR